MSDTHESLVNCRKRKLTKSGKEASNWNNRGSIKGVSSESGTKIVPGIKPFAHSKNVESSCSNRHSSVLQDITNTPQQTSYPSTPSQLITSRYRSSPLSVGTNFRFNENVIHGEPKISHTPTTTSGTIIGSKRRGRPPIYRLENTQPIPFNLTTSPININHNVTTQDTIIQVPTLAKKNPEVNAIRTVHTHVTSTLDSISCGNSKSNDVGQLSNTPQTSRPRGRPKKIQQANKSPIDTANSQNDTVCSEDLRINRSQNIPKRRGRPPKYTFSDNDLIAVGMSATNNSNIRSCDSDSSKKAGISTEYRDIGDAIYVCNACKACLWKSEAMRGNKSFTKKIYSLCCLNGKVELPTLNKPPQLLLDLFSGNSDRSRKFVENVRRNNMMFSLTSIGGKVDHKINSGKGPYVYRMCGQNYHLGGSLIPQPGKEPRFC
ncbi:uncharacterized protein [Rutidosis leptorrhynchoides]|uniref:uncharacterized protein isoform X3 n=1 Tax=Rutidosis leptorrhynchoides TaxID=125765 RepID=UPI003A99C558